MKRRGSALVSVLVASALLLGLGTVVSVTVVNTTKLNQRYSENIDLELAAKSSLNYGIDYLINNYQTINFPYNDNVEFDNKNNDENVIKKSITIDRVEDVENEFIVTGIAAMKKNEDILAKESITIKINNENTDLTPDPTPDPIPDPTPNPTPDTNPDESNNSQSSLVFEKLFNIGGNIKSFGNNNQNAIEYFQYSGTCDLGGNNNKYDSNGNRVLPQRNEELANINLGINTNEILQYISKYSNETIKTHNRESISADNTTIKYNQLNGDNTNISLKNSSKVLFANGGTSQNSNSIEVVGNSNNNSELIFGGNTTFNTGMNIKNVENSEIIVNGDLNVWNGAFKIENTFNSVFIINGNLKNSGSGIDINLKNSVLIVAGDIEPQNNFKVTLENSAIICLGNLKLNTQINIYNNGDSFIYCGKDFSSNSDIRIYNNNGGYTPNSSVVNNAISKFISN